ncbi:MAG: nucleotidyltransferase [Actinomycetota bacterium]
MGAATEDYWLSVLSEGLDLLETRGSPHLVIGSLATGHYLGQEWNPTQDIDFFVEPGEAELLLEPFREAGFSVHRKDERWLYKVARPNVTIDLIFLASEAVELDGRLLARARGAELEGIPFPVPSPEDLWVMKVLTDNLERQSDWYECLRLISRSDIDWAYLQERALATSPDRVLAALLYARSEGVAVDRATVDVVAGKALA